jgi:hypothetical protein
LASSSFLLEREERSIWRHEGAAVGAVVDFCFPNKFVLATVIEAFTDLTLVIFDWLAF